MNESELLQLIPEYVLGTLSEEERRQVDALLEHSAEAREELRSYQEMMVGVAALSPRRQAPVHLNTDFKRLLEQSTPAAAPAPVSTTASNRPPLRFTSQSLLLAAAAALVLILGGFLITRTVQQNAQQQQIAAITGDASAVRVTLDVQPDSGAQGQVSFVAVPGQDRGVLLGTLPELPAGQQYQLWIIAGETPIGVKVYDAAELTSEILVDLPVPARNFGVGITVEPRGGSQTPTPPIAFFGSYQTS
ncbi:MAG: anti-sigma factor [Anaerolineae bacterium]